MAKKISITDIAKQAGVSIASVSYVLNGIEKEKRVSAAIADKIRETAILLNYQPNHIAQNLKNGSTKTIGLIVADIANTYFGDMAKAVEEEAFKNGYTVILGSSDENPRKSQLLVDTLVSRQVDGIIIAPVEKAEKRIGELSKKLPIVLVDRYLDDESLSAVILDNYQASFDAVRHLSEKGYRRIAIIGYKSSMIHMQERLKGYNAAMRELHPGVQAIVGEVRYTKIEQDMHDILDRLTPGNQRTEAIIFATNSLTVAGLYYFQQKQIKIPDDLALIGFDGNVAFDFFYAPLTYIKQPVRAMGRKAVKILLKNISGTETPHSSKFGHKLIERASCG